MRALHNVFDINSIFVFFFSFKNCLFNRDYYYVCVRECGSLKPPMYITHIPLKYCKNAFTQPLTLNQKFISYYLKLNGM